MYSQSSMDFKKFSIFNYPQILGHIWPEIIILKIGQQSLCIDSKKRENILLYIIYFMFYKTYMLYIYHYENIL